MGIDDESSGVRLPTFDGTDARWHVWKAKFVAYACYKGFEGILNGMKYHQVREIQLE